MRQSYQLRNSVQIPLEEGWSAVPLLLHVVLLLFLCFRILWLHVSLQFAGGEKNLRDSYLENRRAGSKRLTTSETTGPGRSSVSSRKKRWLWAHPRCRSCCRLVVAATIC